MMDYGLIIQAECVLASQYILDFCTICIDKMNFCDVSVSFGGVFSKMEATTELNAHKRT